ncbi:MAG: sugar transferase [Deltaproteobacteria bacterium]|nr:sugar transferase [Deltaproteobacteria bacterium]
MNLSNLTSQWARKPIQRWIKRSVDIAASAAGLAVLSPVLLGVAAAIRTTMGSPVFFRQRRPGLNDEPFELLKFRTMTLDHGDDTRVDPSTDAVRLTALGSFLRTWSLDELPQLYNVFVGDMSLIGPRPLLLQYLPRYSQEQRRRHQMPPGITGWAQIHGRNALSWDQKFALDVWYIDHWNLWIDAKTLLSTFLHVVRRDGVSSNNHVTMPEFMGPNLTSSANAR